MSLSFVSRAIIAANELHDLRCFVAATELRSVSAPARRVGRDQPPVSNAIARLERELQLTLLRRHSTGVEPTAAGIEFLRHARTVLSAVERATTEMAVFREGHDGQSTELGGEVRLGVAPPLAPSLLTGLLRSVSASAPHVNVPVAERPPAALLDALETRQLDLGLMWLPVRRSGLQSEGLSAMRLAAVTAPDHPASTQDALIRDPGAGAPLGLRELADEPWVVFTAGSAARLWVDGACMRAGFAPRIVREVDTWTEAKAALEAGLGITLLPPECVTLETAAETLRATPVADAGHGILGLVFGSDAPATAVQQKVRALLISAMRGREEHARRAASAPR